MTAVLIKDNIWIGGILALRDLPSRFTVISLLSEAKLVHLSKTLLQDCHTQIIWNLADKPSSTFLCSKLIEILFVMDNTSGPILVHCAQGVSRSAAVCAAWLLSHHCCTLQDSLTLIRQASPTASPNLGFIAALKAIERNKGNVGAAVHQWNSKQLK